MPEDDAHLYDAVRRADEVLDPLPDGFVDRMVALTRDLSDPDLDAELLLLVERLPELAGTRGGARAYTLRFGGDSVDVLVRVSIADDEGRARLDGWLAPAMAAPVQAHEVGGAGRTFDATADEAGRFEFPELGPGFYRLSLAPASGAFATPAFEI